MSGIVGPRLSTIPPTFFNDYSFQFDGVNNYVKAPLDARIYGSYIFTADDADMDITVSLWFKLDTDVAAQGIFQWAKALNDVNPFLTIQQNNLDVRVLINGGWRGTFSSITLGTWYNIIVTRDSATNIWTGYMDGVSFFTYDDGGTLTQRGNAQYILFRQWL